MAKRSKRRKQKRKPVRASKVNPLVVEQGMLRRLLQRVSLSASVKVPAVPALAEHYAAMCARVFAALGRSFGKDDSDQATRVIGAELERAFAFSQRSRVEIRFSAPPGAPMTYQAHAEQRSVVDTYDHWLGENETALFGKHADARILALADAIEPAAASTILDFGAGTGRNALALARLGYPVDAIEITSGFARMIADQASREALAVRVVEADVFHDPSQLSNQYRMFLASEVASDFRDASELHKLLRLASERLSEGGLLVFNAHLTRPGYTPDRMTREFAQHSYSAVYTPTEIAQAAEGLPLEFVANDSAVHYEREHLPVESWPPTPWFENWATGRDVFELERSMCPVDLRWLVFSKREGTVADRSGVSRAIAHGLAPEARGHDADGAGEGASLLPANLRKAVLARLSKRIIAGGELVLPAVPSLRERCVQCCRDTYEAMGRAFSQEELDEFGKALGRMLEQAFSTSPRSSVVLDFELPMGSEIKFEMTMDAPSVEAVYESWYEALPPPLFGEHADARVTSVVEESGLARDRPVLDLGAGLGRNALWLAERGYAVDAVEFTPAFAEELALTANRQGLSVRVFGRSFLDEANDLRSDYDLVVCVGAIADLRSVTELRQLFEIAARCLSSKGCLVVSVHVVRAGYEPPLGLREWAQQCSAMCFTEDELNQAIAGSGLKCVSSESAYDFERKHLPADAWPPTPVFEEWALGRHLVDCSRLQAPLELRWLVYRPHQ